MTVQNRRLFLILLTLAVCISTTGCIESTFNLADASRLPKWITLPPGLTRADVTLTIDYHTVGDDTFTLRNNQGKKLATVYGRSKRPAVVSDYPDYDLITVNGITELVKLRPYKDNGNMVQNGRIVAMFYVIDDAALHDKVLAARLAKR